jgi:VWFA-related protein
MCTRTVAGFCSFALAVGVAAAALAQTTEAPTPQQPGTTFRSGVTLIRTDVIVRDANGAFVPDLTPDDFQVLEDGVPQEVASLILVHGGRVFNQLVPPPPVREGIILPERRVQSQIPGRIIVFFVDAMHLEPEATPRVRHFVKEVADTLVHDGDLVGLMSNGSAGTAVDLTYDLGHVKSAVDGIVGNGMTPRDLIQNTQEGPDGPGELRWRAHRAFLTVNNVLEGLAQIQDRRKVIIYISTGYDLNPFALQRLHRTSVRDEFLRERPLDLSGGGSGPDGRAITSPFNRLERQGVVFADGELIAELAELSDTATRANTTLYTMDPRGLVSSPDIDYDVPIDAWREYMMAARSSLRTLAELTGGISIVNTNNFSELLRQIDAETSDYYVVGYYTSNPDPTHRRRALRVTVARDGLEVQARDSYTLARTGEPSVLGGAGGP